MFDKGWSPNVSQEDSGKAPPALSANEDGLMLNTEIKPSEIKKQASLAKPGRNQISKTQKKNRKQTSLQAQSQDEPDMQGEKSGDAFSENIKID